MNEQELWKRIVAGDAQAFTSFYQTTAPRLLVFLQRIVGNREAAEDVAQETYTGLWRRPGGYRPEHGSVRSYLFGAGRRRALEWWRHYRPETSKSIEIPEIGRMETRSLLLDALDRLPEEQRTLLWLREVEGLSYVELASTFEIPVGTVRSRLFMAREALRRVWSGENKGVRYEMR